MESERLGAPLESKSDQRCVGQERDGDHEHSRNNGEHHEHDRQRDEPGCKPWR